MFVYVMFRKNGDIAGIVTDKQKAIALVAYPNTRFNPIVQFEEFELDKLDN